MSNKAKIIWLRILHSIICLVIATFGPIFTYVFLNNFHFFNRPHYDKWAGLAIIYMYGLYIIVTLIVLIVIQCIRGKIAKKFTIAMLCVSSIIIIPFLLDFEFCWSIIAMLPLYLLVSWAIDKQIEKLKLKIEN